MSFLSRILAARRRAHFHTIGARLRRSPLAPETFQRLGRSRVLVLMVVFAGMYGIGAARLMQFGMSALQTTASVQPFDRVPAARPDIVDRNGELLATDIRTLSLFAEPDRIVDADEAIEQLATMFPDLNRKEVYAKLTAKNVRFAWLRRHITPRQQSEILAMGIPGVGFRPENKRFYPGGPTAAHILGYVDIDNRGVAGMERYIDEQGFAALAASGMTRGQQLEPVRLSIDIRVQNIVRDVVATSVATYHATAAGAVVLDVRTGEVLGMASAPDFDPNNPLQGAREGWLNRMTNGTFEMGSTFKTFSLAMALDMGKVRMTDTFDASRPIRIGGFTIKDFHGQRRALTLAEVFQYSSNIGTAKIIDFVGIEAQKEYLTRFGLLTRMNTELPEIKTPSQPKIWKKINSITISFGHGVSTTPLQTAVAGMALVNGGMLIDPTFLPRSVAEADIMARRVVSQKTSEEILYLFKLNGVKGSGRNALVPGFDVGGKTGTADKVVNGRYSKTVNFNAFLAAFPMKNPRYIVLTFCDEPKTGEGGQNIAAYTAAPMVREIIRRAAPLLGVEATFGQDGDARLEGY